MRPSVRAILDGFTVLELLVVMVLVGVLAGIAVPMIRGAIYKADAAHIITDFRTVRGAAMEYYSETGDFPPSAGPGRVPVEFVPLLPEGFEFRYQDAEYRWHRWSLSAGVPGYPGARAFAALEVQEEDVNRMAALKNLYRGGALFGSPTRFFFPIE